MASKPTDLTSKTWNKLKAVTVPKTGFGAKLDAYAAAKKKADEGFTRSLGTFKAAEDAIAAVIDHIPDAQKKCNKLLHKDTIALLAAYKPLMEKEGTELKKDIATYQGYFDAWVKKRQVGLKQLPILMKQMTDRGDGSVTAVRKAILSGKPDLAAQVRKAALAQLEKDYDACIVSIKTWREPPPKAEQPHMDDRGQHDALFNALVQLSNDVEGDHSRLRYAISDMPTLPATPKAK